MNQIKECIILARLNKPIGVFLLLWPTLWALWLAGKGNPHPEIVMIFILGVIVMRSAGCIINDIFDRNFDMHVARTRERPLASKKLTVKAALIFFSLLILSAFFLVLLLNPLSILLAFLGALFTIIYPLLKRVTYLPQLGLGIAFAWGVPMAFAALTNTVSKEAVLLFLAAAIWPIIYDTMYAMADREDDLKAGIKSTAILFGSYDRIVLASLQLVFLVLLIFIGRIFELSWVYFCNLIFVTFLFSYQQLLIKDRQAAKCFKAFLNNNFVGLIIFVGIILNYKI